MRIKVTIQAIIDTEKIPDVNRHVRMVIERSAFNKQNDNMASLWAETEINRQGSKKDISLELL